MPRPSRSPAHPRAQTLVSLPCFDIDTGAPMTLTANKTVAAYTFTGALSFADGIAGSYDVGTGSGPNYGLRQATTVSGGGYWLSGNAGDAWGYRYLPSFSAGATSFVDGAISSEPGFYDARGVTVYKGQVYGSDSLSDAGFGGA